MITHKKFQTEGIQAVSKDSNTAGTITQIFVTGLLNSPNLPRTTADCTRLLASRNVFTTRAIGHREREAESPTITTSSTETFRFMSRHFDLILRVGKYSLTKRFQNKSTVHGTEYNASSLKQ